MRQVDNAHAPGPYAGNDPVRANFLRVSRKQVSNHWRCVDPKLCLSRWQQP